MWTNLHDWDGENPYHEDFIEAADVVFLSSEKLPDHRAWMKRQVNAGKRLVVATHGAKGSTVLHRGEDFLEIPAVSAGPVLDVNGAGDNYFSGFLYGLLSGKTTLEAARLASAAGALCVSSMEIVPPGLCPELLESKTRELSPR
jgi:sugar/nucleoside kinase (ribokinase family)